MKEIQLPRIPSKYLDISKPIQDWPGYYVTRDGDIFTIRTGVGTKCRFYIMHKVPMDTGHLIINLRKSDGSAKTFLIHRLVAKAFIPNLEDKPYVCHMNGNPADNRVENLHWGTQKDNMDDQVVNGTRKYGDTNQGTRYKSKQVRLFILLIKTFKWKQTQICKFFGISSAHISRIINFKRRIHERNCTP